MDFLKVYCHIDKIFQLILIRDKDFKLEFVFSFIILKPFKFGCFERKSCENIGICNIILILRISNLILSSLKKTILDPLDF